MYIGDALGKITCYTPPSRKSKPSRYEGKFPSIIEKQRCLRDKWKRRKRSRELYFIENRDSANPILRKVGEPHASAHDGVWLESLGCWDFSKKHCYCKNCKRHWRLYVKRKWRQLKNLLPLAHWAWIRLTLPKRVEKGVRFYWLERFSAKIREYYISGFSIWFYHRSPNSDHIHILLGSDTPILKDDIGAMIEKHWPKKIKPFNNNQWKFKQADKPAGCVWYGLMRHKYNTKAPWGNMPIKSPIKVYRHRQCIPF